MTELNYFPALPTLYYGSMGKEKGGYTLDWWRDSSIFYHPYLLISFGALKLRGENLYSWRTKYNVGKNISVLGDSGGYQQVSRGGKFNPNTILDWQEKTAVNAGIILDKPPRTLSAETVQRDYFVGCARETKENIEKVRERLEKVNFEVYGVLHGINMEEIEVWFKIAVEPFGFEHVSFAPRVDSSEFIALSACFLKEMGIKNIHLLAVSSFQKILLLSYLKKLGFNSILYDSSTFAQQVGKFGSIYSPYLTRMRCGFSAVKKGTDLGSFFSSCDCPICNLVEGENPKYLSPDQRWCLALHNLYQTIKFQKFSDIICQNREELDKFISQIGWKRLARGFDVIDNYKDLGFEKTKKLTLIGVEPQQETFRRENL